MATSYGACNKLYVVNSVINTVMVHVETYAQEISRLRSLHHRRFQTDGAIGDFIMRL